MRRIIVWALFIVALLTVVPSAEAQSQIRIAQAGAFRIIDEADYGFQIARQQYIDRMAGYRDFPFYGGYYGNYGADGYFYGRYDRWGQPLSQPVRVAIGAGIGATGGAYIGRQIGGRKGGAIGTVIGGVTGGVIGYLSGRRRGSEVALPSGQPVQIDRSIPPYYGEGGQVQRDSSYGYDGPVEQGPMPSGPVPESAAPAEEDDTPMFSVNNSSEYYMELYDQEEGATRDKNRFLAFVKPGECVSFPGPELGFRGWFLVPFGGGIKKVLATVEDEPTGMSFVMPQGGGGGV